MIMYSNYRTGLALGRRLYKGTWRSVSLAVRFFEVSPALFADMTMGEVASLVQLVNTLSERSYDLASRCLDVAPGGPCSSGRG